MHYAHAGAHPPTLFENYSICFEPFRNLEAEPPTGCLNHQTIGMLYVGLKKPHGQLRTLTKDSCETETLLVLMHQYP